MEKELIEHIAKSIVSKPEDVSVNLVDSGASRVLELRVNEEDIAKIIGKNGRVAKAIRTLLHVVSASAGKRTALEIID